MTTPRTTIEHADNSADAIRDLSEELAEELLMKPHEAADLMVQYYMLKNPIRVVLSDGESLTPKKHKAERKRLNAILRHYIAETGEPIEVEGTGTLILKPKSRTGYALDRMLQDAPAMFDELMRKGWLTVSGDAKEAARLGNPALEGLSKYEVLGQGTPSLEFER